MKGKIFVVILVLVTSVHTAFSDDGLLTGDPKLACEATMCLSSPNRPSECNESLRRYFGIHARKPGDDEVRMRAEFLKKCPSSSSDSNMSALADAIASGAGYCDAASLNSILNAPIDSDGTTFQILNNMPANCQAYYTASYTNFSGAAPMYVGTPNTGGYWVDAKDYPAALQAYNEAQAEKAAAAAAAASAAASQNQ
jgi:hypothetical protein